MAFGRVPEKCERVAHGSIINVSAFFDYAQVTLSSLVLSPQRIVPKKRCHPEQREG